MQRNSYHVKTPWYYPSINMVKNDIDPNNNSGIQRLSYLHIPNKHRCYYNMNGIAILIPMDKLIDTIINIDC